MLSRRAVLAGLVWAFSPGILLRARPATSAAANGRAYRLLEPPQPVEAAGGVEIIEFFWYGCPYCFELQPLLEAWLRQKPADTVFRRVPAVRSEKWEPYVRIFYALTELGELERLHQKVYEARHVDGLELSQPEVVTQWATRHGIEREQWLAAYTSSRVDQGVESARESTSRYQVPGTPSFVVDGRYLTSSLLAGSVPGLIPVLDELIRRARADRARAQASYSTVTDFARLRGLSTSVPRSTAV
jgi:thiol:disulfide interchange protein DsbA